MAVLVAGSINVDVIQSVASLPRPGETVLATGSERLPGGKGANQAVAAARMGAAVEMIAALGDDDGGRWMLGQLRDAGVGTGHVRTLPGLPSGTAYIAVDAGGENQIIVAPGANGALSPQHLPPIEGPNVLVAQLEVPVETIRAFFSAPRPEGCIRILNAAPAVPEAAVLFGETDILIVNQHELALYLDLPDPPANADEALVARQMISRPDQAVIVTLGAQGALAVLADSHVHAPGIPVEPLDSIGAGDCFVGTLAAVLDLSPAAGRSIEKAIAIANASAALCTQARGAIPAMPTRMQVETMMETDTQGRGTT